MWSGQKMNLVAAPGHLVGNDGTVLLGPTDPNQTVKKECSERVARLSGGTLEC